MTNKVINLRVDREQFPDQEAEVASTQLTLSNIQMIKNLISTSLNDLIALPFDASKPAEYAVKVAQIRGEISAYSWLLNQHESVASQLSQQQQSQSNS
jgi:hypothetical protein